MYQVVQRPGMMMTMDLRLLRLIAVELVADQCAAAVVVVMVTRSNPFLIVTMPNKYAHGGEKAVKQLLLHQVTTRMRTSRSRLRLVTRGRSHLSRLSQLTKAPN